MANNGKTGKPAQAGEKLLEISKYPNRRYYDKTRSKHLTLEEIYAAIRDGYEIHVTDSKTGDDITAKTLAHIILELDSPKLDVFPVALLHRLLRANEQLVVDFTQKYFSQAFMAFMDSQKKTEQYLRQAMGLQSAPAVMTDWAKLMWGPFNPAGWAGEQTPTQKTDQPTGQVQDLVGRITQLQQELVQLQNKIDKTSRGKSRGKPNSSKR
jgi:polyhydroxyalkanoate synthesis repressor PhaR